jgi:UDP-3-O-[3-hydroxymyristoyl] glucosamine N-acyltransferase
MRLLDFFDQRLVLRDSEFIHLGRHTSSTKATLCYADTKHTINEVSSNLNISAVITTTELAPELNPSTGVMISENPRDTFFSFYKIFYNKKDTPPVKGAFPITTYISPSATVHSGASIGKNCKIGEGSIIYGNVEIEDNCSIGAGAIIGCDGILYCNNELGDIEHINHAGKVLIKSGATLLSRSTVSASVFPEFPTEIGHNSIIGINATIGHDAVIKDNVVIGGNCIIARGTIIENRCIVSASSFIKEYVLIGSGSRIRAGSVVIGNIPPNSDYSGNFARPHRQNLATQSIVNNKYGSTKSR